MTRFIMPIIFIGLSIAVFLMFTDPIYNDISTLQAQVSSYNEALDNSKALENERDKLTAKENAISQDNLTKLEKLLPANIDNIRLILEMEQVASPYGMSLKDISFSAMDTKSSSTNASTPRTTDGSGATAGKSYGTWDLSFSTTATYDNFLNFVKALESNLRIVDISSINFTSSDNNGPGSAPGIYRYNFKIQTYYLKN